MIRTSILARTAPTQDWRAASEALLLAASAAPDRPIFLHDSFSSLDLPEFKAEWHSFYLNDGVTSMLLDANALPSLPDDAFIYFGQAQQAAFEGGRCQNELTRALDAAGRTYDGWFAEQSSFCQTGYLALRRIPVAGED